MKHCLRLVASWVLGMGLTVVHAATPSLQEVETTVQNRDQARLRAWVQELGTTHPRASDILMVAGMAGDTSLVADIMAWGVSPNATNQAGIFPLLHMARHNRESIVRLLLEHGANPDQVAYCHEPDCPGHRALFEAVSHQNLDLTRQLLELGADPKVADYAPAKKADALGDVELYRLLEQFNGTPAPAPRAPQLDDSRSASPVPLLNLSQLLPAPEGSAGRPPASFGGRLSVIADENHLALADLLSARLAEAPGWELVERQELDRILEERKLTRQYAADLNHYGAIAQMLRADALLLLNTRPLAGQSVLECRLVRVRPGLVLDTVYAVDPTANAAEWATRMAARLAGMGAKVVRSDAIALSLLNIRAAVRRSGDPSLDRTLGVLLADRLAHHPDFILLERADMQRLDAEVYRPLMSGRYLVDGTVEPALDATDTFTLGLRLQPMPEGAPLTFQVKGRRSNPAPAIDAFLQQMTERLKVSTTPGQRDLPEEARWYAEEAAWALAAEQPAAAASAAEAAWALGRKDLDVARLRVQAALETVRRHDAPGYPGPGPALDSARQGFKVWMEVLESPLAPAQSPAQEQWLTFGLAQMNDAVLALLRFTTATDLIREEERLDRLSTTLWRTLERMHATARSDHPQSDLAGKISEIQAAHARLLQPDFNAYVTAVTSLLQRDFSLQSALTRARIRSHLLVHGDHATVMVQTSRTSGGSVTRKLPFRTAQRQQVARAIQSALAAEDRYMAALMSIWITAARQEPHEAALQRLQESLFDMTDVLAEGGEVFELYWDRFRALDNLGGVHFFAKRRVYSEDRSRMWERNTAEHTEFRRQLFLRIAAQSKAPATDFKWLISLDQYTDEQAGEVKAAQARLGGRPTQAPIVMRGRNTPRRPAPVAPPTTPPPAPAAPVDPSRPLTVTRLWNPFDLGQPFAPEFRADYGTMAWEGNRIWVHGCTLDDQGTPDRHYIFAIDPDSLRTETFVVPEASSQLNARLIVTATHLAFFSQDVLVVQDRRTGRWEAYRDLQAVNLKAPALIGDVLYLVIKESPGNAVVAFDLNQRTTEVLASTRRRPPTSPMDDPTLELKSVETDAQNQLIVVGGRRSPARIQLEAWSPVTRSWIQPSPKVEDRLSGSLPFVRSGKVGKQNGIVGLHYQGQEARRPSVPLTFAPSGQIHLPPSRYGPQVVRPDYFTSFPGGVVLVPPMGAAFWIIPQSELDRFVMASSSSPDPLRSASRQ